MQVVWDTETYPNCFLLGVEDLTSPNKAMFEISDRRDDSAAMFAFLQNLIAWNAEMVGFNNLGFDYPILHDLLSDPHNMTAAKAYAMCERIINSRNRWAHQIWPDQRYIKQIDLYLTNHFDNMAKTTSLKALQFAMRSESIEDLPIPPGTVLTSEQIDITRSYCDHDISETKRFAQFNEAELAFRRALVPRFGTEVMNWADTKIGGQWIIQELGDEACYIRQRGKRREPRQTIRTNIVVRDIIFPYIEFQRPECLAVLRTFQSQSILAAKPGALSQSATLDGFQFDFGVGGIHGSRRGIFRSDADEIIIDADVTSLYPSIAIENGMYPEHLGERFVSIYSGVRDARGLTKKGTPDNAALKLALNGTYGNTNNAYSPLFDSRYTMQTTINGQLLLLMFSERLMAIPGLLMIQVNTDGVTFRVPRAQQQAVLEVCRDWQALTRLKLEYKLYDIMCVRDVNNYIAVDDTGKTKRKGAYDYPPTWADYSGWWNRDYSALVVPMAAEHELLGRGTAEDFINAHADPFDFMLRAKTPSGSQLVFDPDSGGVRLQRIVRYHAATELKGRPLIKNSPPVEGATPGHFKRKNGISDEEWASRLTLPTEALDDGSQRPVWCEDIHTKNKSVYEDRTMSIHTCCRIVNDMKQYEPEYLDRSWYVREARKLVDCFNA